MYADANQEDLFETARNNYARTGDAGIEELLLERSQRSKVTQPEITNVRRR
jgi:hypothetical protein